MLGIDSLYEVIEKKESKIVVKLSSSTHPIFQAHFPNNSLLPGFCHVDILETLLKNKIKKIKLFKLQTKTFPDEIVEYKIDISSRVKKIQILKSNNQMIGKLHYEL